MTFIFCTLCQETCWSKLKVTTSCYDALEVNKIQFSITGYYKNVPKMLKKKHTQVQLKTCRKEDAIVISTTRRIL